MPEDFAERMLEHLAVHLESNMVTLRDNTGAVLGFRCSYCVPSLTGSVSLDEIYEHYARKHPGLFHWDMSSMLSKPYRVIICRSRHWQDAVPIADLVVARLPAGTTVIHGGAPGADSLAAHYARQCGLSVEQFPAEWDGFGCRAGPLRNRQMLASGVDAVYAFRLPGVSPGTDDMIRIARAAQVPVLLSECGR